jgi:heme exporter protein CcmB
LASEALAMLGKDLAVEWRSRHGVTTAVLFAAMTVVALALATAGAPLQPDAQAGLLWVGLIFAGVTALARGFVVEEEQGTADLLRLTARPSAVLAGKMLFHFVLLMVAELVLVPLSLLLLSIHVADWLVFGLALAAASLGLAVCVTISGALVARASSRGALVGVLSLPVLVPLIGMAVLATKAALGAADPGSGWTSVAGMLGWTLAIGAAGFWLFEAVWKE